MDKKLLFIFDSEFFTLIMTHLFFAVGENSSWSIVPSENECIKKILKVAASANDFPLFLSRGWGYLFPASLACLFSDSASLHWSDGENVSIRNRKQVISANII